MDYPLGRVYDESNMIVERENARIATEATLLQQAVASILSTKARGEFKKRIDGLALETKPFTSRFDPPDE